MFSLSSAVQCPFDSFSLRNLYTTVQREVIVWSFFLVGAIEVDVRKRERENDILP